MGRLDGRVAWVTGAARGQGRAHAVALAAEGADVVVSDLAGPVATVMYPLPTAADLDETAELVQAQGRRCLARIHDVRDGQGAGALVADTVAAFGRLDIVVANAGIVSYAAATDLTDEMWQDVIDVDLTGAFRTVRAALPTMVAQRYGRIVATSSMAGRMGIPNLAHYCAAKWGLIGMIKAVAMEVGRHGVTANVVCPATTLTPMVDNDANHRIFRPDLDEPTLADALPRIAAASRLAEPYLDVADISRAVLYLVADAGTTTGAVLPVCLGSSATMV